MMPVLNFELRIDVSGCSKDRIEKFLEWVKEMFPDFTPLEEFEEYGKHVKIRGKVENNVLVLDVRDFDVNCEGCVVDFIETLRMFAGICKESQF